MSTKTILDRRPKQHDNFTRDLRILPRPETFEEKLHENMLQQVDCIKSRIVDALNKSNDGRAGVLIDFHPDQHNAGVKMLKKWAKAFGYVIEAEPPNRPVASKIFPWRDLWARRKKRFIGFIIKCRLLFIIGFVSAVYLYVMYYLTR